MVTMKRDGAVRIEVRGDHPPAHFHILSANTDVMIDLYTFDVIRGQGSRKEIEAGIEWAKANHDAMLAKWREINGRG